MHSEKIMKVLGAGLTAAALTLGAAAPALAKVTLEEPVTLKFSDTSDEVLDYTGSSTENLVVRVPMTSTSEAKSGAASFDNISVTINGLDEWGNSQEKELDENSVEFLTSKGVALGSVAGNASDVAWLSLTLNRGNVDDLVSGTYCVTKIVVGDEGDDKKVTTFEPAEAVFELKSSTQVNPVTVDLDGLKIDKDSIDLDGKKSYSNKVTVSVSGFSASHSGSVTFVYESPSGKELKAVAKSISGGDKAEATIDGGSADWKLNGTYTLKSIKAKAGNDLTEISSDDEDLSDGDFTVTGGADTTVYRLYNPNSSEHFYTVKSGEKDLLVEAGWKYEGVAFETLSESESGAVEVFRVYNPNGGDHHFTMSEGERDLLVAAGWKNEGVAFYSAGSTKDGSNKRVYRVYNPNAETGSHHYTLSSGEKDLLVGEGWNDEGTAWFARN